MTITTTMDHGQEQVWFMISIQKTLHHLLPINHHFLPNSASIKIREVNLAPCLLFKTTVVMTMAAGGRAIGLRIFQRLHQLMQTITIMMHHLRVSYGTDLWLFRRIVPIDSPRVDPSLAILICFLQMVARLWTRTQQVISLTDMDPRAPLLCSLQHKMILMIFQPLIPRQSHAS